MSSPKDRGAQREPGDDLAAADAGAAAAAGKPTQTSPRALALTILVAAAIVVAAALYQEPILYFFRLGGWDRGAPARTVRAFLAAARDGDQQRAQQYVSGGDLQPLVEEGKWVGYSGRFGATSSVARLSELVPDGEVEPSRTDFIYLGPGAAMVTMPARANASAQYRLERVEGSWKLTAIRLLGSPSRPDRSGGSRS
jgi:hypothetical protein